MPLNKYSKRLWRTTSLFSRVMLLGLAFLLWSARSTWAQVPLRNVDSFLRLVVYLTRDERHRHDQVPKIPE